MKLIKILLILCLFFNTFFSYNITFAKTQNVVVNPNAYKLFWKIIAVPGCTPTSGQVRSRCFLVDETVLFDKDKIVRPIIGYKIRMNLFYDYIVDGVVETIAVSGSQTTISGELYNIYNGYFHIIYEESNNIFIMHIASPSGIYEVTQLDNDIYKVVQLNAKNHTD